MQSIINYGLYPLGVVNANPSDHPTSARPFRLWRVKGTYRKSWQTRRGETGRTTEEKFDVPRRTPNAEGQRDTAFTFLNSSSLFTVSDMVFSFISTVQHGAHKHPATAFCRDRFCSNVNHTRRLSSNQRLGGRTRRRRNCCCTQHGDWLAGWSLKQTIIRSSKLSITAAARLLLRSVPLGRAQVHDALSLRQSRGFARRRKSQHCGERLPARRVVVAVVTLFRQYRLTLTTYRAGVDHWVTVNTSGAGDRPLQCDRFGRPENLPNGARYRSNLQYFIIR